MVVDKPPGASFPNSLPLLENLGLCNHILIIPCFPIMLVTLSFVLVYMDDSLITGNSILVINMFKASLSSTFHIKDLGVLKYFLGIEVARSLAGIYLCQASSHSRLSSKQVYMEHLTETNHNWCVLLLKRWSYGIRIIA